jgi:hypothetical protein
MQRHVLHDVLARREKTYRAFFKRVKAGQTPGYPRLQVCTDSHSFTYKAFGNGVPLDTGVLERRSRTAFSSLPKLAASPCAGLAPLAVNRQA